MYGISAYICAKFVVNEKKHTIYDIYMDPMGDDFRLMISVEEKNATNEFDSVPHLFFGHLVQHKPSVF